MSLFFKAERRIQAQVATYFDQVDACMAAFEEEVDRWLDGQGPVDAERIHRLESAADDLRRDIEMTLYGKALLPESRGDLLGLIEATDRVANEAETVVWIIETQRLVLPEVFREDYRSLVHANAEAWQLLRKTAEVLFDNPRHTPYLVKSVDAKESESDEIERALIRRVFDSDLDTAEKLLLKNLIVVTGDISDRAENAADRMGIIAIKRRV